MKDEIFPGHTGELATDSPRVWRTLGRLHPEQLPRFEEAYRFTAENGGLLEHPVIREPGIRFNPRPARIVDLLFSNGFSHVPELLTAGFLCCIQEKSFKEATLRFKESASLLSDFRALLEDDAEIDSLHPQALFMAFSLDCGRHLHMTDLGPEEQAALYKTIDARALRKKIAGSEALRNRLTAWCEAFSSRKEIAGLL